MMEDRGLCLWHNTTTASFTQLLQIYLQLRHHSSPCQFIMRSGPIFALAAAATAADVSVVWRHEKVSGSTSLTVHSSNDNKVLAKTCGNTIGSLDFHVDEHGAGTFTTGGTTFAIQTTPQNGVSCNRIYNGDVAVVECTNVKLDVPENAALSADCFHDETAKESFRALKSRSVALSARSMNIPSPSEHANAPPAPNSFRLRGRQVPGSCGPNPGFELTGNGNPHQNYFHKQLSENIFCGASPSCLVGQSKSESFSIGFSTSGSADGWFSAGFDVQKSWTTGNDYQCYGAAGDTVCVWYNTAHTAYTGRPYTVNSCDPGRRIYRKEIIMKSPNKANRGGGYYCVVGTCRAQGDGYWDDSGRAGGP
ncbi:hypothetical protein CC86DRAFT_465212 [Ophiobolus disseminans]|uniref:Uncharacterized protein n=1 Tax=Ophiobolus disseminans TaxID=1469910 RepID=A0A6A7A501_9PLEO|nr:hypothetical protein CC86DRAFT_465212 [Ophiobolus disseminans]